MNYASEKWTKDPDDDDVRGAEDDGHKGRGYDQEQEGLERGELLAAWEEERLRSMPAPTMRKTGNTGPKAVIADYNEARQKKMDEARRTKELLMARAQRSALRGAAPAAAGAASSSHQCCGRGHVSDDDLEALEHELFGSDEDLQELEGGFYAQYKAQKLREIISEVPTFGVQREIGDDGFVAEIDDEHPSTLVVIQLFEDRLPPCHWLDAALEELSSQYPFVKFLRIRASLANPDFDPLTLPALLVYQNKALLHSLFRVHEDIPRPQRSSPFNAEQLRAYLIACKVLPTKAS